MNPAFSQPAPANLVRATGIAAALTRVANAEVGDQLVVPGGIRQGCTALFDILMDAALTVGMQVQESAEIVCRSMIHTALWANEQERNRYVATLQPGSTLDQLICVVTLIESLGEIPDFGDRSSTGRKLALTYLGNLLLTVYEEKKHNLPGHTTKAWWRVKAVPQERLSAYFALILNDKLAADLLVKAIDVLYRRFFRLSWAQWTQGKEKQVIQLCEYLEREWQQPLAGAYRNKLRTRTEKKRRQVSKGKFEEVTIRHFDRPKIAVSPCGPKERNAIQRINNVLAKAETYLPVLLEKDKVKPLDAKAIQDAAHNLLSREYSETGIVSKTIHNRRAAVRAAVLRRRQEANMGLMPNARTPGNQAITSDEWIAAEGQVTKECTDQWEAQSLAAFRTWFGWETWEETPAVETLDFVKKVLCWSDAILATLRGERTAAFGPL